MVRDFLSSLDLNVMVIRREISTSVHPVETPHDLVDTRKYYLRSFVCIGSPLPSPSKKISIIYKQIPTHPTRHPYHHVIFQNALQMRRMHERDEGQAGVLIVFIGCKSLSCPLPSCCWHGKHWLVWCLDSSVTEQEPWPRLFTHCNSRRLRSRDLSIIGHVSAPREGHVLHPATPGLGWSLRSSVILGYIVK